MLFNAESDSAECQFSTTSECKIVLVSADQGGAIFETKNWALDKLCQNVHKVYLTFLKVGLKQSLFNNFF